MTSVTEKHEGKNEDAVLSVQNDGDQQRSPAPFIDPEKEKKIVRKFDMFMMPQFVIILILAYVYSIVLRGVLLSLFLLSQKAEH